MITMGLPMALALSCQIGAQAQTTSSTGALSRYAQTGHAEAVDGPYRVDTRLHHCRGRRST